MDNQNNVADTQEQPALDIPNEVVEQLNDANNRVRQSLVGVPTHIGVTVLLDVVSGAITNPAMPENARAEGARYFATIAASVAQANGVSLEELQQVVATAHAAQAAQAIVAESIAQAQQQAEGQTKQ